MSGRPPIGKTLVIAAGLTVLVVYSWVLLWVGRKSGQIVEAARRQGVDPRWARSVTELLRDLLAPPAADAEVSDFVVLPEKVRRRVQQAFQAAPGQAEDRAMRRRSGWL